MDRLSYAQRLMLRRLRGEAVPDSPYRSEWHQRHTLESLIKKGLIREADAGEYVVTAEGEAA